MTAAAAAVLVVQKVVSVGWSPLVPALLPELWVPLLALCGGYTVVPGDRGIRARAVVRAGVSLAAVVWVAAAFVPGLIDASVNATARSVLLGSSLIPLTTLLVRRATARYRRPEPPRILVLGQPEAVDGVLAELDRAARKGLEPFHPVGVVVPGDAPRTDRDVPEWHGYQLLQTALFDSEADAVLAVPGPGLDHAELRRMAAQLQDSGRSLLVSSGLRDVDAARIDLAAAGGLRVLHVRPAAITGISDLARSAVERVCAGVLLTLCAPFLAVLALVIRTDSPGGAIFKQVRVGRHGREFTVYKLRTMCDNAHAQVVRLADHNESDNSGVLFKIRSDPRITRVGALLRKYSLDELPQLINVVRGEMSLVGPRPALASEVSCYSPDLRRRLAVRPGITGLWQVSGRSDLPWEETVRLDLQYVDNWSWGLDLRILARTAGAVLGHRGAY
jgi:exopolysaccharide biosynthesis polyprenyl glycosylphosphotransferase